MLMCKLFVRQVVSTVPIVLDVVLKIWKSVSKSYLNIIFEWYKCIVISINNQQQFESSGVNSIKPEVFMISIKVPGLWSEREVKTATSFITALELHENLPPQRQDKRTNECVYFDVQSTPLTLNRWLCL